MNYMRAAWRYRRAGSHINKKRPPEFLLKVLKVGGYLLLRGLRVNYMRAAWRYRRAGSLINKKRPPEFLLKVSQGWRLPTLPLGIAVPSALTGLTSLFGMGRGGSPSLLPPFIFLFRTSVLVCFSGDQPVYGVRERKNKRYSCYVVLYSSTRSTTEVSGY